MKKTVFYSWQSDLPNPTNRGFILEALKLAAEAICGDISIDVEPVIDRDTTDVAGSPEIAGTIFQKIDRSDVFVPDVSLITPKGSGKHSPNPNVLVELGFAAKARGWERIVMVMNTAFGKPKDLPFDLKNRRVLVYELAEGAESKAEKRRMLAHRLEDAIRTVFKEPDVTAQRLGPPPTPEEQAISSIESQAPDRAAVIRRFTEHTVRELTKIEPDLSGASPELQRLKDALDASIPLVTDFGRIASRAAEMADVKSLSELYRGLERIAARYKPREPISYYEHQFDHWRFIGYELMVMLAACLIREGLWEILGEILGQDLILTETKRNRHNFPFSYLCENVILCEREGRQRKRTSYQANLLEKRHSSGSLASEVNFTMFMEADYFLFLRTILPPEQGYGWSPWIPHTAIYMSQPPRYVIEAERVEMAQKLGAAIGVDSPEELRNRLNKQHAAYARYFSNSIWFHSPFIDNLGAIERIGSR